MHDHPKAAEYLATAGRELADARAALAAALAQGTAQDLVDRYTGALFDAIRIWQLSMWGPDYVDPVDGPPAYLTALAPPPGEITPQTVAATLDEIARREFPDHA
ncbi:hypothetical protein [Streptomyces sp. NPDC014623]|uniref:hypothetical protein n=1 Tax=Streptomyces sp. NPDC014623 TaxID=3364875 RepID=UPI0036F6EEF5